MNELPRFSSHARFARRDLIKRGAAGFGMIGLASTLLQARALSAAEGDSGVRMHHAARAKRVIFLFMNGAPSHVDTFDPKPALAKHAGEEPPERHNKNKGMLMPSPFRFEAHGENGVVMSELFPHLAHCADHLCVIRSMQTDVPNHEPGLLLMLSGHRQPVRPSIGSWVSYGLGAENRDLPSFVVLSPGDPVVGPQLWSNSFLPGEHQGVAIDTNDLSIERLLPNLKHPTRSIGETRRQLDFIQKLNERHREARPGDAELDAQIRAFETAFRMQIEASDAFDVSREPDAIRDLYGRSLFGQSCLLARRLAERGVRMILVNYVTKHEKQPWDTHTDNNGGHRRLCADSDRATAALITDLAQRGLLDDTLVVWGGEFGRTPYAEIGSEAQKTKPGRDHHHTGFSMLLAGGGVRGGFTYGATDELGIRAVENPVHIHDLHATILHLLGIDHEKLTYRWSGRDFRLTDVHGNVAKGILA